MEESSVGNSDEKNKFYPSDTRYQNESISLEFFQLDSMVNNKQFVEVTPLEAHGGCEHGGLDYFDVVRQNPVKIMEDAIESCSEKVGRVGKRFGIFDDLT